jgi:hypothetical protein
MNSVLNGRLAIAAKLELMASSMRRDVTKSLEDEPSISLKELGGCLGKWGGDESRREVSQYIYTKKKYRLDHFVREPKKIKARACCMFMLNILIGPLGSQFAQLGSFYHIY